MKQSNDSVSIFEFLHLAFPLQFLYFITSFTYLYNLYNLLKKDYCHVYCCMYFIVSTIIKTIHHLALSLLYVLFFTSDAPIWLKTDIPIFRFFITDICRYR